MFDIQTVVDLENMKPLGNDEGKNSAVYLADDKQLKHQFIVKNVSKSSIYKDFGNEDEENLFLESSILYKVSHPNITEIQYASYDADNIYMVMPYYKNGSIQSILDERNLTVEEAVKYSLEFLSGLLFVHSYGLVHFDIKPTNILINNNGKATLTDFGLAKYLDKKTELIQPNKLYMCHWPPERFLSSELGRQADIYQVGMTMYRMVNGNKIWKEQVALHFNNNDIASGQFPERKRYLPHVPLKIRKIINKCLEVDADKRYSNVIDIINDLSTVECTTNWQYEIDENQNDVWKLVEKDKITTIYLSKDADKYNLKTTKTNKATGRETRVVNMCKNNITEKEANKLISGFTQ